MCRSREKNRVQCLRHFGAIVLLKNAPVGKKNQSGTRRKKSFARVLLMVIIVRRRRLVRRIQIELAKKTFSSKSPVCTFTRNGRSFEVVARTRRTIWYYVRNVLCRSREKNRVRRLKHFGAVVSKTYPSSGEKSFGEEQRAEKEKKPERNQTEKVVCARSINDH